MKTYTAPQKTLMLWQIRSVLLLIVIAALTIWISFLTLYFLIVTGVTLVILAIAAYVYLPLYIKRYSVSVGPAAIIIRSGVFIRRENIMPRPRMVYAQQITSPLARIFRVSSLCLNAARASTVTLELDRKDIEEILKEIG